MKHLTLVILFAASCAFAQTGATLEAIKAAADAGDPAAQDKLAVRDHANAELWYRKAAAQGYAHSQGQLGHRLLLRSRMTFGLKPADRAAMQNEALKWITLAANQGDKQGQGDLADVFLEGKLVKADYLEAYKWGELCSRNPAFDLVAGTQGRSVRDAAVLKMNTDQIAEARRRVAAFVPHQPKKSEVPTPAWVKNIKLKGISGVPGHRMATIDKQTLEKGERGTVKIDGKPVAIQCLEITEKTATIAIEGLEAQQTLTLD